MFYNQGGHYDAKDFLLYYYYGGMIYTALKDYEKALYMFEIVSIHMYKYLIVACEPIYELNFVNESIEWLWLLVQLYGLINDWSLMSVVQLNLLSMDTLIILQQAITTPSMAVSHIMLESYKKFILVALILHGKVRGKILGWSQFGCEKISSMCKMCTFKQK